MTTVFLGWVALEVIYRVKGALKARTTDGQEVILTRYTQPEPEQRLSLEKLKLTLPEQPPPKITARQLATQ